MFLEDQHAGEAEVVEVVEVVRPVVEEEAVVAEEEAVVAELAEAAVTTRYPKANR
jgi:hypothetical protein